MPSAHRNSWTLNDDSFRRLLEFLDPDPEAAAARYQKVREKLIVFFEWKGCIPGVDFADETMDRVARKLDGGLESVPSDPYVFFHGVAVNVARERWRRASEVEETQLPAVQPFEAERRREAEIEAEQRLDCLRDCLDGLTPASRELLTAYHLEGSGVHIGRRKQLADRLKVPGASLRLRVFRIRRQMERCMTRCASAKSKQFINFRI